MAKISDVFDLQMGKTPARANEEYWIDGANKWVSIGDLSGYEKYVEDTKEKITNLAVAESGIKAVPSDTVIMSFKLSLGKVAITKTPVYTNEAIMAFLPKQGKSILPDYFYHYFSSIDWSKGTNRAVMGATLNKATLGEMEIQIPSMAKQIEIADRLNKIDELISLRKQQLAKLDELVNARFVELFGDCLSNPKGWKTKCLEDIAEVGSSKRVFVEELREDGIPFYRGTEVGALAEGKQITPELFITEQHYAELCKATGTPRIGDLLMPSICPDGRIWLVNTDKPFYFKDGRVLWVHAIDTSYNPVFLLYTLKDRIMTDYSSIASGTTFAELKIFALKKCQVFDVPITLQNKFAAFIKQVDKSKLSIQQSLDKLELLKKALMQKYFG